MMGKGKKHIAAKAGKKTTTTTIKGTAAGSGRKIIGPKKSPNKKAVARIPSSPMGGEIWDLVYEDNGFTSYIDLHTGFPSLEVNLFCMYCMAHSSWLHENDRQYSRKDSAWGKWLLFFGADQIDGWWQKMVAEMRKKDFVHAIKVSTANAKRMYKDQWVIIVYCAADDATRVRERLRAMGVQWKIGYKLEKDTGRKYAINGDKKICVRWE